MQNTKYIAKGAIEMFNAQGFEGAKFYLLTKHISRLVPDFSIHQPSVSAKLRACFNNKQGPPSNTGTNSLKQRNQIRMLTKTWNGKTGVKTYTVISSLHENTLYTAGRNCFTVILKFFKHAVSFYANICAHSGQ